MVYMVGTVVIILSFSSLVSSLKCKQSQWEGEPVSSSLAFRVPFGYRHMVHLHFHHLWNISLDSIEDHSSHCGNTVTNDKENHKDDLPSKWTPTLPPYSKCKDANVTEGQLTMKTITGTSFTISLCPKASVTSLKKLLKLAKKYRRMNRIFTSMVSTFTMTIHLTTTTLFVKT